MPKEERISLRELENETRKFLSPSTEKEKDIVAAAVALIGERGIDGATTAEIAKRAGVTERTLFRYFPTKKDLVRRVMLPMMSSVGVKEFWERLEALFRTRSLSFKDWLIVVTNARLEYTAKNAEFGRTVMIEILQNRELRDAMQTLWAKLMWDPVIDNLKGLQNSGQIRKDVDIKMLARAIHCIQIGYSLTRFVLAPDRKWRDADEIEKMADLLTFGSSKRARAVPLRKS